MKCYIKDYPRPQFVRNEWENLNGEWNFVFDYENEGEKKKYFCSFPNSKKINVPFTYETSLSGICDESVHYVVWYNKKIYISKEKFTDKYSILNFEGSDYTTKVWINGNYVGCNRGGYSRFSFNIQTYIVDGENDITVKVEDSLSKIQPRGKQRYKKESWKCWYVQTTGIWKTVWLEWVSKEHIKSVKNTPKLESGTVKLEINTNLSEYILEEKKYYIEVQISYDGQVLNTVKELLSSDYEIVELPISSNNISNTLKIWSPSNPNLYDITYTLYCDSTILDKVSSYFGIRDISIIRNKIFLNKEELYLKMILDQGYWNESHLTPPNEEALVADIDNIIKYGYNCVRKHQKIEDERFLYWCDVKGLLVWSEMANCYLFNDNSIKCFTDEWIRVVKQNYNHPSIITWVPINESWGVKDVYNDIKQQSFVNSIYYLTKSIDGTGLVITNDGWEHTISDIITIHDYSQDGKTLYYRYKENKEKILNNNVEEFENMRYIFASGYEYKGQPVIISEYGGIAINSNVGWGYGKQVKDKEEFLERFTKLTKTIQNFDYISGYCYTQLTDVMQEINGLMYFDRKYKVEPDIISKINNAIFKNNGEKYV